MQNALVQEFTKMWNALLRGYKQSMDYKKCKSCIISLKNVKECKNEEKEINLHMLRDN